MGTDPQILEGIAVYEHDYLTLSNVFEWVCEEEFLCLVYSD